MLQAGTVILVGVLLQLSNYRQAFKLGATDDQPNYRQAFKLGATDDQPIAHVNSSDSR